MKFAMQGAQDSGEFFTPPSLVQTIVNVIEPEHGTVFDPACGSGGMFVQSSHFIEDMGEDTSPGEPPRGGLAQEPRLDVDTGVRARPFGSAASSRAPTPIPVES